MSALAHWLEEDGIATTLVALVRPHVENVRPPRALWTSFELGRPLGPPNDPDFQRAVLKTALELLESDAGPPLLVDYPLDDPDAAGDPAWQCPVRVDADDLAGEIAQVQPHYERAVATFGRTTVGLSGVSVDQAGAYLAAYVADEKAERPRGGMSPVSLMRFCADDVKAFYLEAAGSGEGRPSSRQMMDWFWNETVAGRVLKDIYRGSAASPDKQRQTMGVKSIVPGIYQS